MKKDWLELVLKFASRRLIAVGFAGYEVCLDPNLDLWQRGLLTLLGLGFLWSQTYLDKKRLELGLPPEGAKPLLPADAEIPKPAGEGGRARIGTLLVVLFVVAAVAIIFVPKADAEILPYIDKLDLQIGPGIEIADLKPLTVDEVLLATAKVYERWRIEARIGGLVSDSRRALIFNVARNLSDLIVRDDNGEEKSLLPTVGLWFAGDVLKNEEGKLEIEFIWGFNAVLAEY